MDIILSPRLLNQTADAASDESETEIGTTTQTSTNPSILDNDLQLAVIQPQQEKIIIYPTAKYLEINNKKISSFDLLVHPPKRQRLQSPSNSSYDSFPDDRTRLQTVHFENEKMNKIFSIGSSCTRSSKGSSDGEHDRSKTFVQLYQSANLTGSTDDDNNLLDWEKTSLYQGRDTNTPQPFVHHPLERIDELAVQSVVDHSLDTIAEQDDSKSMTGDDADTDKWAEFPSSKNYIYYVNYSHQFNTIFPLKQVKAHFKTVNEKDENKNFLTSKSKSEEVNRKFMKPVYRLTGVINYKKNDLPAPDVNQRLTDVVVMPPPFKRRKLNAPGDDDLDQKESPFTIILQTPMSHQNISNYAFLFPTIDFHLNAVGDGESNLTIEDVTDECNDNEVENVETILAAGDPDTFLMESTSCCLVDFRSSGSDYEDEAETEHLYNLDGENPEVQQEVLLKPNPQLTFSSSMHSLPQNDRNDATLDKFLERRRKSDYFVGKLVGLSKSIMKLYQKKQAKVTKQASNNGNKGEESEVSSELGTPSIDNLKDQSKAKVDVLVDVFGFAPLRKNSTTPRVITTIKSFNKKISESSQMSNSTLTFHGKSTGERENVQAIPSNNLPSANESSLDYNPTCCWGGSTAQRPLSSNLNQKKMTNEDSLPKTSELPLKDDSQNESLPSMNVFKRFLKLFSKSKRTSKKVRIKAVESDSSGTIELSESGETSYDSLEQRRENRRKYKYIGGKEGTTPPCYHCSRIIARHTDSREFYRERRMKFFKELKEFQEDSLKVYLETTSKNLQNMSALASMNCSKLSMRKVNGLISENVGEGKSSRNIYGIPSSGAALSPRKAISTSALSVGETRLRNFLLPSLPIPPIIDMIVEASLASCKNLENGSSIRTKGDADSSCLTSFSGSNEKTEVDGNTKNLHNNSSSTRSPENNNNITVKSTNDTNQQGNLSKCFSPTKGILKTSNKI